MSQLLLQKATGCPSWIIFYLCSFSFLPPVVYECYTKQANGKIQDCNVSYQIDGQDRKVLFVSEHLFTTLPRFFYIQRCKHFSICLPINLLVWTVHASASVNDSCIVQKDGWIEDRSSCYMSRQKEVRERTGRVSAPLPLVWLLWGSF